RFNVSRGAFHSNRNDSLGIEIDTLNHRFLDVLWKIGPDGIDLRLRVLLRVSDLDAQVKLDCNRGIAFSRYRLDVAYSGNRVQRLFDALGDFALYGFRRRSRVFGLH